MSRPTAPIRITDLDDPRLEGYRDMSDGALMRVRGQFVAEGRLVVERVLGDARYRVESVLLSHTAAVALAPALAGVPYPLQVFEIPAARFHPLTGHDIHRGCLALVRRPVPTPWQEVAHAASTLLVLESITNADNVGGILRSAHALGAGGVLLSPTSCDPLYRKAIRTSMGAVFRVPWATVLPWPDAVGDLRAQGYVVAALTPGKATTPLATFVASTAAQRVAFLLGTEGHGLSPAALEAADVCVRIPMAADADSLNVGVAAAVALSRRFDAAHGPVD